MRNVKKGTRHTASEIKANRHLEPYRPRGRTPSNEGSSRSYAKKCAGNQNIVISKMLSNLASASDGGAGPRLWYGRPEHKPASTIYVQGTNYKIII